jgi:hypothetical protein
VSKLVLPKAFEAEPVKVVWNYTIEMTSDPTAVEIPTGALFLAAGLVTPEGGWMPNAWELWYEIRDHEAVAIPHVLQMFGTGDLRIPKCAQHLWTEVWESEQARNRRVWHLYEYPSGTRVEDD